MAETPTEQLTENSSQVVDLINRLLTEWGVKTEMIPTLSFLIALSLVIILSFISNLITKKLILNFIHKFADKTKTKWDDILIKNKVFTRMSHLVPAIIIYVLAHIAFPAMDNMITFARNFAMIYMIIIFLLVVDAFFNSIIEIYDRTAKSRRLPIKSFIQAIKVIIYCVGGIFVLSTIIGKDVGAIFAGLGALTAVLILVFKDTLLGFVAGIQLAGNRMVQKGDWIEMPKYGADGDVIDISLTTIKVQNWDKTISTIPTYSLVTDSFRNWRGMSESGGRRIKRAINIDMNSIKFCSPESIERFKKFHSISEYLESRLNDIQKYNQEHQIDNSQLVNGRRLTNIGTFRAYIVGYLKNHPNIHKDMTFLVRQLPPNPNGLPIEIYVFSNDQVWANYEAIQADIFDHLLAVIPEFELRVFQNPTGADFSSITK